MVDKIDLVEKTSSLAEKYITLESVHPTRTYSYKARNFYNLNVVKHELHAPKCAQGDSWLYYAIPAAANPSNLQLSGRLYVGAQTQDRMFRGDGLKGQNYHHAEMRSGRNGDNMVSYIRESGAVVIYRVEAGRVESMINSDKKLSELEPLLRQPRSKKKHLGWWLEQYILYSQEGT